LIDELMSQLLRMGEFETCADPRGYIRTENRLFYGIVEAVGLLYVRAFPSALECAADLVARALLGSLSVVEAA
jgi:hypothetical protein